MAVEVVRMRAEGNAGALAGIRVLDLSQVMAGPYCTMLLGDLGADVIKVEPPAGDTSRRLGEMIETGVGPESPGFWAVNRNKRSLVLNLKDPQGVQVARRLVPATDVLVENYRPGTMERLGLGYDDLRPLNPRLIYASISGYGQTGPLSHRGGFDLVAQGESGIMSITGTPGGSPVKCGIPVCDLGAALFLTYGILAALLYRARTGEGQRLETSLLEAGLGLSVWEATEFFRTGQAPQPTGSGHRMSAPYQALRCRDGYITVGAATQRSWERLCHALHLEELLERPEFATDGSRVRHREALAEVLETITIQQPRAHWLGVLERADVPCGPINTYPEVFAYPHVQARGMLQEIDDPTRGRIRQIGPVVKFSRTPARIRYPAPLLGEHSTEVLAEAGYSSEEIDPLIERFHPRPTAFD